jgi:hypothetical protein
MALELQYVIETFRNPGEPSHNPVRARPYAGQGLSATMRVSCSTHMRKTQPAGVLLLIRAKVVEHASGTQFLYANPNASYRAIAEAEAREYVKKAFPRFRK